MKRNRSISHGCLLLCTVLLLCFFTACNGNSSAKAPPIVTSTEDRVGYSYGYANLSLERRNGWVYEIDEYEEGCRSFGISFWPEGSAGGDKFTLHCYPNGFAVMCGTGLSSKEITVAGRSAHLGTYFTAEKWAYIVFHDTPLDYAVECYLSDFDNTVLRDEAMEILDTAQIALGGYPTQKQAEQWAAESITGTTNYSYSDFDVTTGVWTVTLDTTDGKQVVKVDIAGNIVE